MSPTLQRKRVRSSDTMVSLAHARKRCSPKITVIDGAIGYTGGMNIGREHLSSGAGFSSPRRKTNRDTTQPTGPDQG
jgi:phosphatidylserine/phosphatidylglycerophosphate/cardiolipin synthase-like enzyme